MLPPHVVIEQAAVGGAVNVRMRHIHPVALDRSGHAADKDNRAVALHPLHDSHMGQGIVYETVPIVVPGIIEKHQIAGLYDRTAMELAMLAKMVIDQTHAVGLAVCSTSFKEVDAVGEVDGSGHSGTIVRDAAALALDRFRADQVDGGLYDRPFAKVGLGCAAAVGKRGNRLAETLGCRCSAGAQGGADKQGAQRVRESGHTDLSIAGLQNHARWQRLTAGWK